MKRLAWLSVGFLAGIVTAVAALIGIALRGGIGARAAPSSIETVVARQVRHVAIPRAARERVNPLAPSAEVLARGRAHWADHCASCHGNDGRGETPLGRGLYPKAPDMRAPATQRLSDGELVHIVENGVRFTGMPAWGSDAPEAASESWHLVHFIRHLPDVTPEEAAAMGDLNPRTRAELADEEETRRFLEGEAALPLDRTRPPGLSSKHSNGSKSPAP